MKIPDPKTESRVTALSWFLENTHGSRDPDVRQARQDALAELLALRGFDP
jgi:hypothetical protein